VEQEHEKEKHVSNQLDEVKSEEPDQEMILMKSAMFLENQQFPAKSIQEVEACCVQGPTNMWLEHESPEERRLRDSWHQAMQLLMLLQFPLKLLRLLLIMLHFLQIVDRSTQARKLPLKAVVSLVLLSDKLRILNRKSSNLSRRWSAKVHWSLL
jgi:hypothetical protein